MRALMLGIAFAAALAAPAMACGPVGNGTSAARPAYAVALDNLLPEAKLPAADMDKVRALRAQITDAVAAGQWTAAYQAETEAMSILGYRRLLSRCGPGSWEKIEAGKRPAPTT